MQNRRRYKRITKTLMSWLNLSNGNGNPFQSKGWDMVTVRDVGAGGILFNYDKPIEEGTKISLKISFPFKPAPIVCEGRIVRNERIESIKYASIYRIAAEFNKIADSDKQLIDKVANDLCA
jgi:hypothetical protein